MTALVASLGFVPMALETGTAAGAKAARYCRDHSLISATVLTLVVLLTLYTHASPAIGRNLASTRIMGTDQQALLWASSRANARLPKTRGVSDAQPERQLEGSYFSFVGAVPLHGQSCL